MRISDWSSDVCSSDLLQRHEPAPHVDDCSWDRATCIQTGPESSPMMQAGCRPSASCCVAPGFLSFCESSMWAGYWKSDAGQGHCFATLSAVDMTPKDWRHPTRRSEGRRDGKGWGSTGR